MSKPEDRPPFFQGVMPFTWKGNRLYRVYIRPHELLFLRAGSAGDVSKAVGAQFGLIGGLIGGAVAVKTAKANQKRQQELDEGDLDQLLGDHKHNFRLPMEDLLSAGIEPPSFWLSFMYQQHGHVGVFRFTTRKKGELCLCINSVEDMQKAIDKLSLVLGDRVAIRVQWDERKKKFLRG